MSQAWSIHLQSQHSGKLRQNSKSDLNLGNVMTYWDSVTKKDGAWGGCE